MVIFNLLLAAVLVFLVVISQNVHAPGYIIWGSGPSYPKPEPGFVLASLADLKMDAFVTFYNNNGFVDVQQDLDGCCVFAIGGGYLVIGGSSNFTYLAPYSAGGQHQCAANLQSPVFFGGAFGVGPYQGTFIGKLTPSDVSQLNVVPTLISQLGCGGLQDTFGIYRKIEGPPSPPTPSPTPAGPPYVVYGVGQDFPVPPAGYRLMSFKEFLAPAFITYYNANYLTDLQQDMLGCCTFNTTDGFVTIGTPGNFSYLGPYTNSGSFQCQTQLTSPVAFGGEAVVGPYALQFIGQLTPQWISLLNVNPVLIDGLCAGTVNSFGLYIASGPAPSPTPSPAGHKYAVYATGQAYPSAPSGYRLMTFKEVISNDFITYYNANYLPNIAEDLSGCCTFNTTDGFVTIGTPGNFSYLGPYSPSGVFECTSTPPSPIAFGGEAVIGPWALKFIGKLTPDLVSQLGVNPVWQAPLCSGVVNSFALFISTS